MAKKTIATLQKKVPKKMTKIIKIIKYNKENKYFFEEKMVEHNIVKKFF